VSRILIVEDEIHIQRLLQILLEDAGWQVQAADSAEAALTKLSQSSFDLVLLDIVLPGMDGLQALMAMKAKCPDMPVILVSALAQENVVLKGIKLGAIDYIRKPFDPKALVDRVSKVMTSRRAAG
jgi:DNA-binding response OmpR family regulator